MTPRPSSDVLMPRRLLFDVQREMPFYEVVVGFRNAVEAMEIRRHRDDPDWRPHLVWWGFGRPDRQQDRWRRDDDLDQGDDGIAGSREPRRPYGGRGTVGAMAIPIDDEALDAADEPVSWPKRI
jgi:hypothetical protein